MKFLKYLMIAVFTFLAFSCSDYNVTPRDGEDEDEPIVQGGTGGSGGGAGQGG